MSESRVTVPRGLVSLVGAGPGDPGLLTVKAARLLAEADVLVYDALASAPITALAPPACERIYVGKRARNHALPQEEITALIVRLGASGKRVVRLKGGDPFIFGRGGEEAQALREAGVRFEIVPGITSAIAAPAYAGIPVTHRSHNTSFVVATGHEDPTKGVTTLDYATLGDANRTVVFLMAMGRLAEISAALQTHGRAAETPVAVVQNGTTPAQRTVVGTLATIASDVEAAQIGAPAIVVVGDVVRLREHIAWFDTRPLFGKRVLLTRPAGEAATQFAARLWELGAEPVDAPTIEITGAERARRRDARGARARGLRLDRAHQCERRRGAFRATRMPAASTCARSGPHGSPRSVPRRATPSARAASSPISCPKPHVGEALAAALVARTTAGARVLIFRAEEARDVVPQRSRKRAARSMSSPPIARRRAGCDDRRACGTVRYLDVRERERRRGVPCERAGGKRPRARETRRVHRPRSRRRPPDGAVSTRTSSPRSSRRTACLRRSKPTGSRPRSCDRRRPHRFERE